ncbi:MAG TPA: relaxase/mobilization nuclease domain-containing protein [Ruminococcus sp.]|nr:relaxase/mobilization nuclease domain-containing protein [Ruminococcus sp.]
MDILTQKRITDNGDGAGYFKYCVAYAYKEKLEPGELRVEIRGYGVSEIKDIYTYQEMYVVKEYYGKTGDNPVMHFVVSYDNKTVRTAEAACALTQKIAMFFAPDYQLITVVHKENQGHSDYHAHIILNTVNLKTGKLYHSGSKELFELGMFIHNLTGNFCKCVIKYEDAKKLGLEKKTKKNK